MKTSRKGFMRPIAWVATWVIVLLLEQLARLICGVGGWLVSLVSGWSTIAVIVAAVFFGGTFISVFFYSALFSGTVAAVASEYLYPSKKGARYWFFGIYEILGCCIIVLAGVFGFVSGGPLFWFYARYVWLMIFAVSLIFHGVSAVKNLS